MPATSRTHSRGKLRLAYLGCVWGSLCVFHKTHVYRLHGVVACACANACKRAPHMRVCLWKDPRLMRPVPRRRLAFSFQRCHPHHCKSAFMCQQVQHELVIRITCTFEDDTKHLTLRAQQPGETQHPTPRPQQHPGETQHPTLRPQQHAGETQYGNEGETQHPMPGNEGETQHPTPRPQQHPGFNSGASSFSLSRRHCLSVR